MNGQKADLEMVKLIYYYCGIDKGWEKVCFLLLKLVKFSTGIFELFGGGRAQLRLTDPQAPLESGWKLRHNRREKLQNLSLLSGAKKHRRPLHCFCL